MPPSSNRYRSRQRAGIVLFALWLLGVVAALLMPMSVLENPVGRFLFEYDGLIHVALFFGLAATAGLLVRSTSPRSILLLAAGLVVVAALTEWVQGLAAVGRAARLGDFAYDVLGLLLGLAAVLVLRKRGARAHGRERRGQA